MPHQTVGQKAIALMAATDQSPTRLWEARKGDDTRRLGEVRGGTYLGREVCERVTTGRGLGITRGVGRVR